MRSRKLRRFAETASGPLIVGGLTVIALDLARRVFRHTRLFCPEREPIISWNPEDYGIPRERVEDHWIETDDGELLFGWYCKAEQPIASAVFCHGNTGNLTNSAPLIPHLLGSGINVLLFDYRGFGQSTGFPSFSGVVSDGVCAARYHDRIRPKHLPSLLYGYSLGGAVAAQVIRHRPFAGLILQSTFTNVRELARCTFRQVPLHLFTGSLYDTRSVLETIQAPVLIIHGSDDETVPCSMGRSLFEACASVKQLRVVEGGKHKDLFTLDGKALVATINHFAADLSPSAPPEEPPPPIVDQIIDSAFRYVRRHLRTRSAHEAV
jgi:pimeloyl-ACP methyl ester carboxylesterase